MATLPLAEYSTGINEENPAAEAPTWQDYGRSVAGGAFNLDASMNAGARYVRELLGDQTGAEYFAAQESLGRQRGEGQVAAMSPGGRDRLQTEILSGKFLEHPFQVAGLKLANMAPSTAASLIALPAASGVVSATLIAGATGGTITAAQMLDDYYSRVDDMPDAELQKQSRVYAGLRESMNEEEARREFNIDNLGAKPALTLLFGAVTNAIGPAGQIARAATGKGASVLAGEGAGVVKRFGAGALEAGLSEGAEEAGSNLAVQTALVEGQLQSQVDPLKVASAGVEGAVLGAVLGGPAGALSGGKSGKKTAATTTQPEVTSQQPKGAGTGNQPPPPDDVDIGNPDSAPTRSKREYPAAERAKAISKRKPIPTASEILQDAIVPEHAVALDGETGTIPPRPEDIMSAAVEEARAMVQAATAPAPGVTPSVTPEVTPEVTDPGLQPTPQAAPIDVPAAQVPQVPENAMGGLPTGSPTTELQPVEPQAPVQVAPIEPERPAEPSQPRVLEDVSPAAKRVAAVTLKQQLVNEKGLESEQPGVKHRTKAEVAKREADATAAKKIFDEQPDYTIPNNVEERLKFRAQLEAVLKRAEEAGIKIPAKISDTLSDHVVSLREHRDMLKLLGRKNLGKDAQERVVSFVTRQKAAKGGDFSVMRSERKAEGEQKMRREQGDVESKPVSGSIDESSKLAKSPEEILISREEGDEDVAPDKGRARPVPAKAEGNYTAVTSQVTPKVVVLKRRAAAKEAKPAEAVAKATTPQQEAGTAVAQRKPAKQGTGLMIGGMKATIQVRKGEERTGKDKDGKKWSVEMPAHYGEFAGVKGADGENVDAYFGPKAIPRSKIIESVPVFVIDQVDPDTRKFDEHKVMVGFDRRAQALETYDKAFSDARGMERVGNVTEMSWGEFQTWLKEGDTTKPAAEPAAKEPVQAALEVQTTAEDLPEGEVIRDDQGAGVEWKALHTYTLKTLLPKFNLSRFGPLHHFIRAKLMEGAGDVKVHIIDKNDLTEMAGGRNANGFYVVTKDGRELIAISASLNHADAVHTVVHEGIHALAIDQVNKNPKLKAQIRALMNHVFETHGEDALMRPGRGLAYGFKNEHEFLAEAWGNARFQEMLRSTPITRDLAQTLGLPEWRGRSLWAAMVDLIRQSLGLPKSSYTALEAAISLTEKASWKQLPKDQAHFIQKSRTSAALTADEVTSRVTDAAKDYTVNSRAVVRRVKDRVSSAWMLAQRMATAGQEFGALGRKVVEFKAMLEREKFRILEKEGGLELVNDITAYERKHGAEKFAALAELGFDASNMNVNLGPNADNSHLGKDATAGWQAKKRLPELHARYDALDAEAKALLQRSVKFFRDTQNDISLQAINNILQVAGVNQPGVNLKDLAERIHQDGVTDADKALFKTNTVVRALNDARGIKQLKGWYLPFRRYGDWVVTGYEKLDAPNGATKINDNTVQFHDASDTKSRRAAQAFVEGQDLVHTDTRKVWVDKRDPTKELEAEDVNAIPAYRVSLQTQHTSFHATEAEARSAKEALEADGLTVSEVQQRYDEAHRAGALMGADMRTVLAALEKQTRYQLMGKTQKDAVRQTLMEASVRMMGSTRLQSSFLQRRRVAGMSQDLARVTADYARSASGYLAKLRFQPRVDDAFASLDKYIKDHEHDKLTTRRTEMRNELYARFKEDISDQPQAPIDKFIRRTLQISRLDKLAGISFHVINSQEPWTTSLPVIGGRHGFGAAARRLAEAYNIIGARGGLVSALKDTGRAAPGWMGGKGQDFGFTDYVTTFKDTIARNKMLGGDKARRLGELLDFIQARGLYSDEAIFEVSRYADPTSNAALRAIDRADLMANQMGNAIEKINRTVTAIAAYDLEFRRNNGNHEGAMAYAFDVTHDTMGDYSSWNSAPMFKNRFGQLALQFRKFAWKMYYLLGKTFQGTIRGDMEAARQFGGLMLTHMVVAGALGLPWEPIKAALLVSGWFGIAGFTPDDVERWVRLQAKDLLGVKGGEAFSHGLTRLVSVDTSSRQGLDSLLTFGAPKTNKVQDLKAFLFDTVAGAPAGYFIDQARAGQALFKGEFAKAAELSIPIKAVTDLVRAGTGIAGPKQTQSGRDSMRAYTPYEAAVRAVGFAPATESEFFESKRATSRVRDTQEGERKEFYAKWARANGSERAKLWGKIEKWNRAHPSEARITRADLERMAKRRKTEEASGAVVGGTRTTRRDKHIFDQAKGVYAQ